MSLRRISVYLTAPEKEYFTVPSGHVIFENAWLAWPADSQRGDVDRFVLRNINLEFPAKKLSVISGKTGSGTLICFNTARLVLRILRAIRGHLYPSVCC